MWAYCERRKIETKLKDVQLEELKSGKHNVINIVHGPSPAKAEG
jgi:hypothetical protein